MSIGTGQGRFPGTAARPFGVGPPESAWRLGAVRLDRWSCVCRVCRW